MHTQTSKGEIPAFLSGLLTACLATMALLAPPPCAAMTVQPVILDLKPTGSTASNVVTVHNNFSKPLPVEVNVESATIKEGILQGTGTASDDLFVFPPQAVIQPGETQSFRVQYVGDPDLATSRHYFATIAELPVRLTGSESAIQILYNFQVIVSIAPKDGKPQIAVTNAAIDQNAEHQPQPVITVTNNSPTYGYLSNGRLRIIQTDAGHHEIYRRTLSGPEIRQMIGFGLVASNESRRVQLPLTLPAADGPVRAEFLPAASR